MQEMEFPAPDEGIVLTHFVVSADVSASTDFYTRILGGKAVMEGGPTIVKLANTWIIINEGGGPTDDKPTVVLDVPQDPDRVSAFLNIRVADIDAVTSSRSAKPPESCANTRPRDRGENGSRQMTDGLRGIDVADGAAVAPELIPTALTAASLVFGDGATQEFRPDGSTTYVERGRETDGDWSVDAEGRFCSFWPPSYRACYDLSWIVDDNEVVGLRFIELERGSHFDGRYRLSMP